MNDASPPPGIPEAPLTIEALIRHLRLEHGTVKAFLEELAVQVSKEYLTIDELAKRLGIKKRTIENKMAAGVFRKGVHYFSPGGLRPRFKWSAIVAWLEEKDTQAEEQPVDGIPMARGRYVLGQRQRKKVSAGS